MIHFCAGFGVVRFVIATKLVKFRSFKPVVFDVGEIAPQGAISCVVGAIL